MSGRGERGREGGRRKEKENGMKVEGVVEGGRIWGAERGGTLPDMLCEKNGFIQKQDFRNGRWVREGHREYQGCNGFV